MAPPLTGTGDEAKKSTLAFIDWAASSTATDSEVVRKVLADARDNPDVVKAMCGEISNSQTMNHTRALVILSLLGEMRSNFAEECLIRFVSQPLPEKGTVVEGEILEQTALAVLQAKAVDGLAYLGTPKATEVVLKTVAEHPSRIVRAEAITAYLWNQRDAAEARKTLERFVRKDERVFLDRVQRNTGETAESFNPKLEAYLKAHPELLPPTPEQREMEREPTGPNPPPF